VGKEGGEDESARGRVGRESWTRTNEPLFAGVAEALFVRREGKVSPPIPLSPRVTPTGDRQNSPEL